MVVNPTLDLPGAAREGSALRKALVESGAQVDYLEGRDASHARLLREIGSGAHDILHFAGHGFFEAGDPAQRSRLRLRRCAAWRGPAGRR